jgi:4-amino-4-deoxy-L-arabinose transferase-like glycosyltransferase
MTNGIAKKNFKLFVSTADLRIRVGLLLLASAIVILIGQVGRELLPPDDIREVEVAREMYEGGDYIVPHLAGLPFVEKPPGFPAVVSMAYRIAGRPSAVAARIVAAAFSLTALIAVFLLGRRILGIEGGALATAILAFSQRFCRTAHNVLLDNALTAAIAFALLFTWIALDADRADKKRLAYSAAAFSLGVSFLFKGLVGPALFGSGIFLYLIVSRRFSELRHMFRLLPIIAFLFPILSWTIPFLLHAQANLIQEFFMMNHFGRFMFGYDSHRGHVYFYLLHIWPEFAPGSILLPLAIWMAWKSRKEWENRAGILFLSLFVGPLALLSVSEAKARLYLLPVHPALAMLVAWSVVKGWRSPGPSVRIVVWIVATGVILAAGSMGVLTGIHGGTILSVIAATIVFAFGTTGCLSSIQREDFRWTGVSIAALIALGWSLWFTGPMAQADVARYSIHRPMVEALRLVGERNIVLYCSTDELAGEASFYRNRTAQGITSLETLVNRLAENPNKVVALLYSKDRNTLPPELQKTAKTANKNLHIEARFNFGKKYLLLVSAGPLGLGAPLGHYSFR